MDDAETKKFYRNVEHARSAIRKAVHSARGNQAAARTSMMLSADSAMEDGLWKIVVEQLVEQVMIERPDLNPEALSDEVLRRLPQEVERRARSSQA
jgi:hypothetical protein